MRLVRNLVFLLSGELLSKVATIAAVTYLARLLGPDGYGKIEFAGAALLCAGLLVDQGFGSYGAREIARTPRRTPRLTQEVVTARFALAVIAYLAIALLAVALQRESLTPLLLVFGLSLFGMPLLLPWVFQGHERMGAAALIQALRQVAYAVVVFALVRTGSDLLAVGWAEVVAVFCAAAYGLFQYRRFFDWPPLRPAVSRHLFREGVPIGLSQMFWTLRTSGAVLLVGLVASATDVGYFAGAQRVFIAVHAFVFLYFFNLLPAMTRAWGHGSGALSHLLDTSLGLIGWAAALCGGLWIILASPGVTLLYGTAFAPATSALQWLGVVWVLALISGHYRFGLIAAGHQTAEMIVALVGAVAVAVLVPLGYHQGGVMGAAVGLAGVEAIVWLGAWAWAVRVLGVTGHIRRLILPLGAALGAFALAALAAPHAVAQAALFAVSLAGLAWLLDGSLRQRVGQALTALRFRALTRHETRDEPLSS